MTAPSTTVPQAVPQIAVSSPAQSKPVLEQHPVSVQQTQVHSVAVPPKACESTIVVATAEHTPAELSKQPAPQQPYPQPSFSPIQEQSEDAIENPPQNESLPADFYDTLQPPPDMDDLDNAMPPDIVSQPVEETQSISDDEHHGMRRPTLDEFDALKDHPYVQRVRKIFHTEIIDARLKQ